MGRGDSSSSLAPGFRFHPTDEELLRYYLKRKVTNRPFRFDPIAVIDIYKSEPWDLPGKSKLKSRDLEWYFFSMLDRKYGNGSKTNRATEKGYWKTTGKDRPIYWNSRAVGMKKTLVYHLGRAPRGERSNWVMHEYRLADEDLKKAGVIQDAYVLCRVFQKSGTGPKNGEQYGAPFVEEEWDDDEQEVALLPGEEMAVSDEVARDEDACVEANDLDQKYGGIAAIPLNYYHGETSNYVEHSGNCSGDDQKHVSGYNLDWPDDQNLYNSAGQYETDAKPDDQNLYNLAGQYETDAKPDYQNLYNLAGQYETDTKAVRHEFIAESRNNVNAVDDNNLFDEPFLDAFENPPITEGSFLEANDLSNPVEPSTAFDMVDEYLSFFDANDDYLSFDPSELLGTENAVSELAPLFDKDVNEEAKEVPIATSEPLEAHGNSDASTSKQVKPEAPVPESDIKYPFMKQASHMLGSIPAPPAYASEFPIKERAAQLNAAQASSPIQVTAGVIRIERISFGSSGTDWSFGKNTNVNIILSVDVSQGNVSPFGLASMVGGFFSGKTSSSVLSRGWWCLMFFWALIFSATYKIGTCITAK